jgi:hypothetical protein
MVPVEISEGTLLSALWSVEHPYPNDVDLEMMGEIISENIQIDEELIFKAIRIAAREMKEEYYKKGKK